MSSGSKALYTAETLTLDSLKSSLPKFLRDYTTQETYDRVLTSLNEDRDLKRQVAANVKLVQEEDGIRLDELVKATTFVTYKLQGMSDEEAFEMVFPERAARIKAVSGDYRKLYKSRVRAYAHGRLVTRLMEHSIIPAWIRNHGVYQEAVETQLDIMRNGKNDAVRQKAADSLMTHLAKPEKGVPQVQVNVNEGGGLQEVREMLDKLSQTQQKSIIEGTPVKDITDVDVA